MLHDFLFSSSEYRSSEYQPLDRVMREIPSTYSSCRDDDDDQECDTQANNSASSLLLSLLIQPIVPRTFNLNRTPTLHTPLCALFIRFHLRHMDRNTEPLPEHRISNQAACRRKLGRLCEGNCAHSPNCAYSLGADFLLEGRGTRNVRFAGSFVASHCV